MKTMYTVFQSMYDLFFSVCMLLLDSHHVKSGFICVCISVHTTLITSKKKEVI